MAEFVFNGICAEISFPAALEHSAQTSGERTLDTFRVSWTAEDVKAAEKPELILRWKKPIVHFQYQWYSACGNNRDFVADWSAPVQSKISSGCPLHCFFDGSGMNRYTVALSDCITLIQRSVGVHEESAQMAFCIAIPLDATGESLSYEVTLWRDETLCRWENAIRAVSGWWEEKHPPMAVPADAFLPMYSFWYSFHQDVHTDEVLAECARAKELGMNTVLLDDGWQTDNNLRGYAYCGDWEPVASKIPDMAALVEGVHALGMKLMLWYSVPFVGEYSKAIERFRGKTLNCRNNAYTFDPRYPEVREYLTSVYVKALKDWKLDGFKLDFIDSFRMTPETPLFREGMDYPVLEDAVHRLMTDVKNALCAVKPDILIEFRQSYIGPVMREFGNMLRVGDCPNSGITNRVGMVDLRLTSGGTAVHSDMMMWHPDEPVERAVQQILCGLFCTVQISVNLDRIPRSHVEAIRFWVEFMKEHSDLLQSAPIRAEAPQLLYPVVRTQRDGKSIVACYDANYIVDIPGTAQEVFLVNAGERPGLTVRSEAAGWHIERFDCAGKPVGSEDAAPAALCAVEVPVSGYVRMTRR